MFCVPQNSPAYAGAGLPSRCSGRVGVTLFPPALGPLALCVRWTLLEEGRAARSG